MTTPLDLPAPPLPAVGAKVRRKMPWGEVVWHVRAHVDGMAVARCWLAKGKMWKYVVWSPWEAGAR